MQGGFFIRRCE